MDGFLLLLRIVHIGSAMMWFGGAIIAVFFIEPTAAALGQTGNQFKEHLLKRRRMGIFFPIIAVLTVLSGAALYVRDSGGLQAAWITSTPGLAFTIGGLAAIAALAGGFLLIGPGLAEQTAVQSELAAGDGAPTDAQRARLERANRRIQLANKVDLPLLLVAGLSMAVGRYL